MTPIVLVFGLISGLISALMMLLTMPFIERIGYEWGEILGYSTIVASGLLIFFGIRSYREKAGGSVTFGKAFTVGILITLLSAACYVLAWEMMRDKVAPDFMEKYAAHSIQKKQAKGATPEELEAFRAQMTYYQELYKRPLGRVAMTFLEPFPVGLLITIVSATVLRRRQPVQPSREAQAGQMP